MNDFLDDLKDIKEQMKKDDSTAKKEKLEKKELKAADEIFNEEILESKEDKFERMQNEFKEFVEFSGVKKLD